MSEAFIGEIRIFGFTFAPVDWAFCDGQLLSIAQNQALFAIIGTFYGGDGQQTFALPNFQGRASIGVGTGPGLSTYHLGQSSGSSQVTLTQGQMPQHNHLINVMEGQTSTQNARTPTSAAFVGFSQPDKLYSDQPPSPANALSTSAITVTGQSLPHDNLQPYLILNFCICLFGVFPSRN